MSTTLTEPPVKVNPEDFAHLLGGENPLAACQEKKAFGPEAPQGLMARLMMKSYLSALNCCLSELGWVPLSILEVGTGDGSMISYVGQMFTNAEIVGIDADPAKLEFAKEHTCCRIDFRQHDINEPLPFKKNHFDLVISHGFLGSTPSPYFWLKEMARVSAEGLIVSMPTPQGFRWMKHIPGARKAKLVGEPVFNKQVQPIRPALLKQWNEQNGMNTELILSPMPYTMMLGRKPQKKNQTA